MTDYSAFFILHFLLCHLHPSLSTSHCDYVKNNTVEWGKINTSITHLYLNNCDVKNVLYCESNLPKLTLLNLSSNQIESLPERFLLNTSQKVTLYLEDNKLKNLPRSILENKKLTICSLDCIYDVKRNNINISTCEDIFRKCGNGSGHVLLIVFLLLAILVLSALGLVLFWKRRRYTSNFALPRFLHKKKDQNESDSPHVPCTLAEYVGTKSFSPCQIKDEPSPLSRGDMDHNYENMAIGSKSCAEECLTDLYENTAQFNSEEHLYGNEASPEYYNFQKPHFPQTSSDEDIYILPD
ncbi:protein GAPT [Antechinus flavipes]|uniref:protein GAPT n=1 Tax=Antechinus flavipes TaxID=38775 RepID=UPI0022369AA3|nr:protein GAPT [Antechinus flavipes]